MFFVFLFFTSKKKGWTRIATAGRQSGQMSWPGCVPQRLLHTGAHSHTVFQQVNFKTRLDTSCYQKSSLKLLLYTVFTQSGISAFTVWKQRCFFIQVVKWYLQQLFATIAEKMCSSRDTSGYVGDTPRAPMKDLSVATDTNSPVTVN